MRTKMLAMIVLAATAATPALARDRAQIEREAAAVLLAAVENAPFRTWDGARTAMPRAVRWHLAPPDEPEARVFRRSGWIESEGLQAGVAVCGAQGVPELLSVRVPAGSHAHHDDGVLSTLRESIEVETTGHEPTMVGDIHRFNIISSDGDDVWMQRDYYCSAEGAARPRRCDVTFTLDVRPALRSAPMAHDCEAP